MTTHELARELLELPDIMVCRHASNRECGDYKEIDPGWTEEVSCHYGKDGEVYSGDGPADLDTERFNIIIII